MGKKQFYSVSLLVLVLIAWGVTPGRSCQSNGQCGVCVSTQTPCPIAGPKVCGCDGRTHLSACHARRAGTNVMSQGACGTGGIGGGGGQGGWCRSNADCGQGFFCNLNNCRSPGTCQPRPRACTLEFNPVCGCDGVTHATRCNAASQGVSVRFHGSCPGGSGTHPGGGRQCMNHGECGAGQYCSKATGVCFRGRGQCAAAPAVCPHIHKPVCGCDGQTYPNSCSARSRGINILHEGQCKRGRGGHGSSNIITFSEDDFASGEEETTSRDEMRSTDDAIRQ